MLNFIDVMNLINTISKYITFDEFIIDYPLSTFNLLASKLPAYEFSITLSKLLDMEVSKLLGLQNIDLYKRVLSSLIVNKLNDAYTFYVRGQNYVT